MDLKLEKGILEDFKILFMYASFPSRRYYSFK